ncbi:MAG: EcsC family protein [Paracoccaceae bacterium]|nr:EcsC family protein [Paracoccaceae bacterium]
MTGLPDASLAALLAEQDAYRAAPPPALPRLMRGFARPVSLLTHRLIPPEAVEAALIGADWAASATIRTAAISHDFADLAACEAAALEVRRWAIGYAATGGGAAGAFGAFGLAIDIPTTITLALRTARLTGLSYGFGGGETAERIFILDVLQLAGANSAEEKADILARLARDREDLSPETWTNIVRLTGQAAGTHAAMRRVAATLGVNLSARKLGQLAPVIGAAVGAGVGASFQNDVALAARHAYRERWLQVNEGLIDGRAGA